MESKTRIEVNLKIVYEVSPSELSSIQDVDDLATCAMTAASHGIWSTYGIEDSCDENAWKVTKDSCES